MEKKKCLTFLFCLVLCYSLFQHTATAQSSSGATILSQGNISYPSSNVNLAVIPDSGGTYGTPSNYWDYYEIDPNSWTQDCHIDTSFTYNGFPSIEIGPLTSSTDTDRECDGTWINVGPGTVIVASCWIYCTDSSTGDTSVYDGARLGMDFYAHTSAGYGIVDSYPEDGAQHQADMVMFGTNTWTFKVWDITIPSTQYTTDLTNGQTCNPVQIDSFVLWLQVLGASNEQGVGYFADSALYVNPTGISYPTGIS